MKIYRIKLTVSYFNSGEIASGQIIKRSIELKSNLDKVIETRVREYFGDDDRIKTDVNETIRVDGKAVLDKIGELTLENLKNNYFDDETTQRLRHWELEYNNFKIVGTYNNMIDEFKIIAKLLSVEDFAE